MHTPPLLSAEVSGAPWLDLLSDVSLHAQTFFFPSITTLQDNEVELSIQIDLIQSISLLQSSEIMLQAVAEH